MENPLSKSYVRLTKREQLATAKALVTGKQRLYELVLSEPDCLGWLIEKYEDAEADRRRVGGWGLAKLSLHYNSSIKGKNKRVGAKIQSRFEEAKSLLESGDRAGAINTLMYSDLHPRLFFGRKMRELTRHLPRIQRLYAGIDKRRERLVSAVVAELEEITENYSRGLVGDIITSEDIFQQAALLAYQYTLVYDPYKGNPTTKWSTFAYSMVDKAIRSYVAESTRNVAVPRSVQDRYNIIKKVMEKFPTEDPKAIAALANQLIVKKKGTIKEREIFTPAEVEGLMEATASGVVSLDHFVQEGDEHFRTLAEAVDSGAPSSEDVMEFESSRNELKRVMSKVLKEQELEAIILRYGLDREEGPRTMAELEEEFSRELSKPYLVSLLEGAEMKLKQARVLFSGLRETIYKAGETRRSI